jgi:hypothetical protein
VTSLLQAYQKKTEWSMSNSHTSTAFRKANMTYGKQNFREISVSRKLIQESRILDSEYLYSSLVPYAIMISGSSVMTALAAAFMSSRARRSLGFSKACLSENLLKINLICNHCRGETHLWKPRPSIRTTIHVFGSRRSLCSKVFTYSYLRTC